MVSARAVPITNAREAISSSSEDVFTHRMLDSFCWKCNLRTGTFCCGVFSLILSTLGIITNGVVNSEYHKYFSLERSLMFEEVLTFVVSAFCIHGALKEYRYSLLPWLVVTAFTTIVLFLTALYYVVFGCFKLVMIGLLFLILACLFVYCWVCVASYYAQLKERLEENSAPSRSYIDPSAVTSPAAFSPPPPPSYSVAVGTDNPAFQDKPPSYEEAESSKQSGERELQQQTQQQSTA